MLAARRAMTLDAGFTADMFSEHVQEEGYRRDIPCKLFVVNEDLVRILVGIDEMNLSGLYRVPSDAIVID